MTAPSSVAMMLWSGRTQLTRLDAQRMDFGQGSASNDSEISAPRSSIVLPPVFLMVANQNSPLPVSRFSH